MGAKNAQRRPPQNRYPDRRPPPFPPPQNPFTTHPHPCPRPPPLRQAVPPNLLRLPPRSPPGPRLVPQNRVLAPRRPDRRLRLPLAHQPGAKDCRFVHHGTVVELCVSSNKKELLRYLLGEGAKLDHWGGEVDIATGRVL